MHELVHKPLLAASMRLLACRLQALIIKSSDELELSLRGNRVIVTRLRRRRTASGAAASASRQPLSFCLLFFVSESRITILLLSSGLPTDNNRLRDAFPTLNRQEYSGGGEVDQEASVHLPQHASLPPLVAHQRRRQDGRREEEESKLRCN